MRLNHAFITAAIGIASAFVASGALAKGIIVGNGGDSVIINDGTIMSFDEVEYLEPFVPSSQGDAWQIIDTRIVGLDAKLPRTAEYIRRVMTGGDTLWWFVAATLHEINDHGDSVVIVTDEMKQVAANTDGVIQINKQLYDAMSVRSRASVLMHEAMWTAVGPANVKDGSSIRFLAQLFLNPAIDNMPATRLAAFIKKHLAATSPLLQVVELDIANGYASTGFTVTEVAGPMSRDVVVTAQSFETAKTLQMTGLNPDPRAPFVFHLKARPFSYVSENRDGSAVNKAFRWRDLCGGLKYGALSQWRLPTNDELWSLYGMGMMGVSHLQTNHVFKLDHQGKEITVSSPLVYPAPNGNLILMSAEGRLLNMGNMGADVTGNPTSDIEYINYICVRQ